MELPFAENLLKPLYGHPRSWKDHYPDLNDVQKWEMESLQGCRDQGFKSVLLQASMGTGKTILAAKTAKYVESLGRRVVFLAHMDTLVEQADEKFRAWGVEVQVEHGKRKAKHYFGRPPHVIASKDSLYSDRLEDFIHRTRLDTCEVEVIIDECHLAVTNSFLAPMRGLRPVFTIGLSGTPMRLDGRPLVGSGAPFEVLACRYDFLTACRHRNLVPPIFAECEGSIDLRDIRLTRQIQGMDYDPQQLTARINEQLGYVCRVAKERIQTFGVTRCLAFFPDVATARAAERMFTGIGFSARSVYGDMPQADRDHVKRSYHRGDLDILTSCQMLDLGFDDPPTDGIVLATPTKSAVKILQQGGRGSRLYPGKSRYVVIGFRWETADEGPQSTLDLLLRGIPDEDVRRRSERILRGRSGVNFLEAVEQAEIERGSELADERRRRADLPVACIDAPAEHRLRVYDPLSIASGPLDRQTRSQLRKCGLATVEINRMNGIEADRFLEEWFHTRSVSMSTFHQVEALKRMGWKESDAMALTKRQARGAIYSMVRPRSQR